MKSIILSELHKVEINAMNNYKNNSEYEAPGGDRMI